MTIRQLLAEARERLAAAPFATAREAHLLLGHVLGWGEASLLARDDAAVSAEDAARFAALVERRLAGEPVAYLVGSKEFYGRSFAVDHRVLVPRPETEHLVEAALAVAKSLPARPRILDLGTGSGCIAVTLALELADSRVTATDRAAAALAVTAANARALHASIALVAAAWAAPLRVEGFDLIVSNPPYLDPAGPVMPEVAAWEPAPALWAGAGGLDAYRDLLTGLAAARPGTPLLLEIGVGQAGPLAELAARGGWRLAGVQRDLASIERVVELRRRRVRTWR
ncbi:MAG TPA: peptide chain release factor N(5)-glutamine methyltransferase [Thermoanaerobaculia bacterium]|nr:peptide chain release factor N(5)-glutamine methyltransferase [Thermoanaerobaculia bacterium]